MYDGIASDAISAGNGKLVGSKVTITKMKDIKFISYFTIMLILLQSFSAVANSLDFHATDSSASSAGTSTLG